MIETVKRNKKNILIVFISLLFIFLIIFIINFYSKKEDVVRITTVKNSYSFLSTFDEMDIINLPIYINTKKSDFTIENNINNAYITDEREDNIIKLKVKSINLTEHSAKINNEKFLCYLYNFEIISNCISDNIILNNAFLRLDYNSESIKLNIGSLSIKKIQSYSNKNNLIKVTNLKGIINDVNYKGNLKKDIFGIVIGINNISKKDIEIINIKPLDYNYSLSKNEVVFLDKIPSSDEKIDNLLGYNYNYFDIENKNNKTNFLIESNEKKYILLPLKKISNYSSNCFGLEIEYRQSDNKEIYKLYIDDFMFYSTKNFYEEFDILTYENN